MTDLLIQNCTVLHIAKDRPEVTILPAHDILIQGRRIQAVQPTGQADSSHFRAVIAADGLLAMPGLINTHAHVPMALFRGLGEDVTIEKWFNEYIWPLESNLQPEDVYWGMQLGVAEMIRGGVTAVADHYFYMDEAAKAVEKAGSRALLGWAMFASGGAAMIEQTGDFVQRWQGAADGRIRTMMAPHAPYTCDDDFLRASVKKAQALGVGIHIHVSETMGQTQASLEKRGLTPVQVLDQTGILDGPTILAHVCGATPADLPLLAKFPAGIAHAPKTYLKLAMGTAPVLDFRAAGIPVGLATDGPVSNNTLDLWESLRLMAMTQKDHAGSPEVMPIPEALYIATRESARVYGQADDLGAVEAGYLADIILVDLGGVHHQPVHRIPATLVYNMLASDVRTVIINGQVVMRDRTLLTLDEGEIVAQVRQSMARLAQRNPAQRIQVYNP
ncbi:MAG: amidohydrolase [Anaerolineae bacterium]|nr:amidohydrolase [Anaerolineae bacterium]